MNTAFGLLDDGMQAAVNSVSHGSLLVSSVLMPLEIASLVFFRALKDLTRHHDNVLETYAQQIGNEVRMSRASRDVV